MNSDEDLLPHSNRVIFPDDDSDEEFHDSFTKDARERDRGRGSDENMEIDIKRDR